MAKINFDNLDLMEPIEKPLNPIDIFKELPNLPTSYPDLLDGQSSTLKDWHNIRTNKDVLISLNTGAGKTLIGLLIAQSLSNEGLSKVVYVCSDNSLIEQTKKEANNIGISVTTRYEGVFSDNKYERGINFCITNYHTLLNPFGPFVGRGIPDAVIFDDAHVAENHIRNQFTLTIRRDHGDLYSKLIRFFAPAFQEVNMKESYSDCILGNTPNVLMAPVSYAYKKQSELSQIFSSYNFDSRQDLKYSYEYIKNNLKNCAYFFSKETIEITPPFIPAKSVSCFSSPTTRRIYLSATLKYKTELIRSFGNVPDEIINQNNIAGNGERLVLYSSYFDQHEFSEEFLTALTDKYKVIFSVPNYLSADKYNNVATLPTQFEFKQKLEEFKNAKDPISLILVARYDGIDLPGDTCRIMVMDGVPAGGPLLERFQYGQLGMFNFFENKLVSRITQNFGRINRGKRDYSIHLVNGYDLTTKLLTPKFNSLFAEHLRKQINLCLNKELEPDQNMNDPENILDFIDQVMERSDGWIGLYRRKMLEPSNDEVNTKIQEREEKLEASAINEVNFIDAIWNNRYTDAINIINQTISQVIPVDEKIAGWHNLWAGLCHEAENNTADARIEYKRANQRLGNNILTVDPSVEADLNERENTIKSILHISEKDFNRKIAQNLDALDNPRSTANQVEEATRYLGEILGFIPSREDNQASGGPDVLWRDNITKKAILFELKTGIEGNTQYNKTFIGKAYQQSQKVKELYPDFEELIFYFVGPERNCTLSSTPNDNMYLISRNDLISLKNEYLAILQDNVGFEKVKNDTLKSLSTRYTLENIILQFNGIKLKDIKISEPNET